MRSNLNKKVLLMLPSVLVVFVLGAAALGFLNIVHAVTLADPADRLVVSTPKPNAELSETVDIQFLLYDDENANPEYEIALYQPNCITKYGVIAVNDYSIRGANNVYTKSFNTDGALVDRSAAADGNYCLKVCTTLSNNGTNYSVCDLRQVSLVPKANSVPVITSTPPNSNYIVGQRFGYDVNATDADGDTLSYSLGNAPDFLQINSSTGEITSKGELISVGSFDVLVYVQDGRGGRASQQFQITVVEAPTTTLPSVIITNPGGKDLVVGDQMTIEWEVNGISDIAKTELFYSSDGENWELIQTLTGSEREFEWDFSDISDGEYYLRVVVTDADGTTYENILGPFTLNKPGDEPIETAASVIGVFPREDSEVESVDRIEATLVPSEGAEIVANSLKVLLDDEDITESCALQDEKVICNVTNLAEGKHKVEISFDDTASGHGEKGWFFDVIAATVTTKEENGGVLSRLLLILIICIVAAFLIIIPWLLYSIWRSGRADETYDYDYDYAPVPGGAGGDVNVTVDPRTDLDSSYYNPPDTTEAPPVDMQDVDAGFDEYNIGEGDIGGEKEFVPVAPAPAPVVVEKPGDVNVNVSAGSTQSPQDLDPGLGEDFGVDDIPDWLKGGDNSEPVDTSGKQMKIETVDEEEEKFKGADPYSDYGLAQKDD